MYWLCTRCLGQSVESYYIEWTMRLELKQRVLLMVCSDGWRDD